MDSKGATLDPLWYFLYAGAEGTGWDDLVGQPITHATFGRGRVVRVSQRPGLPAILYMQFEEEGQDQKERKFLTTSFGDGVFRELVVTDELAGRVQSHIQRKQADELRLREEERRGRRQLELETEAKRDFERLKEKYHVKGHEVDSPVSPLYRILLLLEDGAALGEADTQWLEGNSLYEVIGMMYEGKYSRSGDLWDLVLASSNWQHVGEHERALAITGGATSGDPKLMGAILTTRGRAFRNLQDLDTAEQCARDAIALDPTRFYAYNLLGAIYYQRGYPQDGDEQFEKALELGASEKGMDSEIRAAVRIAHREQQREVARFLLAKDPDKYQWATQYL